MSWVFTLTLTLTLALALSSYCINKGPLGPTEEHQP